MTSGPAAQPAASPRLIRWLALFLGLALLWPSGAPGAEAVSLREIPLRPRPAAPPPAPPAPKADFKEADFPLPKAENFKEIMAVLGSPLSPEEAEFLEKNRFLLLSRPVRALSRPDSAVVHDEMLAAFDGLGGPLAEHLRRPGQARFVGPDVFLHALSRYLGERLLAAETGPLRLLTKSLLTGLYRQAAALQTGLTGRAAANWERLTAQLLVPLILIDPAPEGANELAAALARLAGLRPAPAAGPAGQARAELTRVYQARETAPSLLGLTPVNLKPAVDYAVFQPRGPYAGRADSRAYFRAATWLRRLGWDLSRSEGLADAVNFALALSHTPAAGGPEAETRASFARLTELMDFFYGPAVAPGFAEWAPFLMKEAGTPEFTAATAAEPEVLQRLREAADDLNAARRQFPELQPPAAPILSLLPRRLDFPRLAAESLAPPPALEPPPFSALWLPALWQPGLASETAAFLGGAAQKLKNQPEDEWFSSLSSACWRVWETLAGRYGSGYPLYMRSKAFAAKELETIMGALAERPSALAAAAAPAWLAAAAENELGEAAAPPPEAPPPAPLVRGFVEPNIDFWRQMIRLVEFLKAGFQHHGLFPGDLEESGALTRFLRRLERAAALSEKELVGEELTNDDYEFLRLFTLDWMAAPPDAPLARPWPKSVAVGARAAKIRAGGGRAGAERRVIYEALAEPRLMLVLVGNEKAPRLTLGLAYNHYEFMSALPPARMDELWRRTVLGQSGAGGAADTAALPPKNFWYEPLRLTPRGAGEGEADGR